MSKTALIDPDAPTAMARARYVRITPMKARRVIDLIRGMSADEALAVLKFTPQSAGEQVRKVVASAVANAENNDRLDREDLIVTEAYVDEGPTLKRFRPRAQGRAYRIRKRTCHITVVVTATRQQAKPAKKSAVAKLAKKATRSSRAGTAKASTAKVSTAKETPAKATPAKAATKATKADKTSTDKTSTDKTSTDKTSTDKTSKAKTSAPDKDASGTAKRRAH